MGVLPPGELYQYIQVLLKGVVAPPLSKVKVKVLLMMVAAWVREAEPARAKAVAPTTSFDNMFRQIFIGC
jgi:hypothetical protein